MRYAAVELSYLNLGTLEESSSIMLSSPPGGSLRRGRKLETTGPTVSALGILPVTDNWEIYLRAGVAFADMELTTSITTSSSSTASAPGSFSRTSGSEVALWGAGMQFNWGEHWAARLDFQRAESVGSRNDVGEADIDLLSLGIIYRL